MLAWRLCRAPFADLSGEGARRYGGRWNTRGRALVYAAETAALAVLEIRVRLDLPPELLPDEYVLVTINLAALAVETVADIPEHPRQYGDDWTSSQRTPVLRVPSAIIPESCNLLLNPAHGQAGEASIAAIRPFTFDARLWRQDR